MALSEVIPVPVTVQQSSWNAKLGSEVTQGHRNRHVSIPRLLTSNSNHEPISYRFRDKRRFRSKIAKFSHCRVFFAPTEGVRLGIEYRRWGPKTRMMGLLGRERSLTISSAVWIQCTNMTDGQTPGDSKHRAYA